MTTAMAGTGVARRMAVVFSQFQQSAREVTKGWPVNASRGICVSKDR
jgi:hypothetical protein